MADENVHASQPMPGADQSWLPQHGAMTLARDTSFLAAATAEGINIGDVVWIADYDMSIEAIWDQGEYSYARYRVGNPSSQTDFDYQVFGPVYFQNDEPTYFSTLHGNIVTGQPACSGPTCICPPYDCEGTCGEGIGEHSSNTTRVSPNGGVSSTLQCGTLRNRGRALSLSVVHHNGDIQDVSSGNRIGKGSHLGLTRHLCITPDKLSLLVVDETGRKAVFLKVDGEWKIGPQYHNTMEESGGGYIETTPGGTTYTYDGYGKLTSKRELNGNTIYYHYDGDNRLEKISGDMGLIPYFTYDENDRIYSMQLKSDTDPAQDRVYYYQYNCYEYNQAWLTQVSGPEGCDTSFAYDDFGGYGEQAWGTTPYGGETGSRITSETDPENYTTYFFYEDTYGKISKVVEPEGKYTYYEHDLYGGITCKIDAYGRTTYYHYNIFDTNDVIVDALGNATYYTHDYYGNRTCEVDKLDRTSYYQYDMYDMTYTRDALGNETYFQYGDYGRMTYMRDALGRESYYTYDAYGNNISRKNELGNVVYFEYITGGLVEKSTDALERVTYYTYDSFGNRVTTTDALDQETYYTYDAGNALIRKDALGGNSSYFTYDCRGNCTAIQESEGTTYMQYNHVNLVTDIRFKTGVCNYFWYDAQLRRYAMQDSDGLRYFTWDGLNLLVEQDDSGDVVAEYTHGMSPIEGIGTMVAAKKEVDGATYYQYAAYDHRGTVVRLTDENGDVTAYYEYSAWGVQLRDDDTAVGSKFKWQSNWISLKDSEGDLLLSPTRLYSAVDGRFVQRDSLPLIEVREELGFYENSIFALEFIRSIASLRADMKKLLQYDPNGYEDSLNLYGAFIDNPVDAVDLLGAFTIDLACCCNLFSEIENMSNVVVELHLDRADPNLEGIIDYFLKRRKKMKLAANPFGKTKDKSGKPLVKHRAKCFEEVVLKIEKDLLLSTGAMVMLGLGVFKRIF